MDYNKILSSMTKFGATVDEICNNTLGISGECINENVIISPGWQPDRLFEKEEITQVVQSSPLFGFRIWDIAHEGTKITFIRTGFGAPIVMDALLLLGMTKYNK